MQLKEQMFERVGLVSPFGELVHDFFFRAIKNLDLDGKPKS
jgi:hypothetical protein